MVETSSNTKKSLEMNKSPVKVSIGTVPGAHRCPGGAVVLSALQGRGEKPLGGTLRVLGMNHGIR